MEKYIIIIIIIMIVFFWKVWYPEELLKKHNNELSDDFWEEYIRHFTNTLYHPTGTCGIGRVVDSNLKVVFC